MDKEARLHLTGTSGTTVPEVNSQVFPHNAARRDERTSLHPTGTSGTTVPEVNLQVLSHSAAWIKEQVCTLPELLEPRFQKLAYRYFVTAEQE